jgi:hypothetical protein
MYSNKCNANKQFYQEVMEHCDMSEQELNETLLWMEHPIKQGLASQKLMIRPYTNNQNTKDHPYNCQQQQQQKKKKQESDPFLRNKETLVTNNNNIARELLLWVNDWISPTCQVLDLSQSMRTGQVLLQLLEALSAKTIPRCQNQASKSMIMLDNIVEAFKFMNQEGFINNRCTIKGILL